MWQWWIIEKPNDGSYFICVRVCGFWEIDTCYFPVKNTNNVLLSIIIIIIIFEYLWLRISTIEKKWFWCWMMNHVEFTTPSNYNGELVLSNYTQKTTYYHALQTNIEQIIQYIDVQTYSAMKIG